MTEFHFAGCFLHYIAKLDVKGEIGYEQTKKIYKFKKIKINFSAKVIC